MAHDLASMLLCARTLINHNVELVEKWRLAEKKFEDSAVSVFQKDMENYELRQIISELKKADPNGQDIG